MNYEQIKFAALRYADKENSTHVNDMMDTFFTTVEARLNTVFKTGRMTARATVPLLEGQEYYGLPKDFLGQRDVEIRTDLTSTDRVTLEYLSPEQMNNHVASNASGYVYTIIAQQIQISPTQSNKLLEIVYYQSIPALTDSKPSNWLSETSPNVYIFGLLVEISSFLKDMESLQLWEQRLASEVKNITNEDSVSRWSGSALKIRIG